MKDALLTGRKDSVTIIKIFFKHLDPRAARLFRLSLILFLFWIVLTIFGTPQGDRKGNEEAGVTLTTSKENYPTGQLVTFVIRNNTETQHETKLIVEKREEGNWAPLDLGDNVYSLPPRDKREINYPNQNFAYFNEPNRFHARLINVDNNEFLAEVEFAVEKPGMLRSLWRTMLNKPIESALVLLLSLTGKHLALAIVLLTLIIKLILLIPSRKGIIAQQKMQKLQPELDELRKKYKENPQLQAQKMMELWKKHKVHPGSALWPTLIQLPILISLYFVIKDGLQPYNSYLLYDIPLLQNFDYSSIKFEFLWLNLAKPDPYVILPVTIGMLQFLQLKTMTVRQQKRNEGKEKKEPSPQESVMKMMNYILPGIVVFFSATLPAAVGLYWGVSTLFAIGQQEYIHHRLERKKTPVSKTQEIIIESPAETKKPGKKKST